MARFLKWLVVVCLALVLVLAAMGFALHRWLSTDDFRQRVQRDASSALGVPVVFGDIRVNVWPLPAVALDGLTVQSQPPVTFEKLEVRPEWRALVEGKLLVKTLIVRKAVLPQKGIDAILLALQKKKQSMPSTAALPAGAPASRVQSPAQSETTGPETIAWLPRRTVLDDVTWVSNTGRSTAVTGEAVLGADTLPDSATLKLIRGNLQGLQAELKRDAVSNAVQPPQGGEWSLRVDVGGGRIEGKLGLQRVPLTGAAGAGSAAGELVVQAKLITRDVEVTALTAPEKPLSGKLEANTTLHARAATTDGLVEALQTQTTFTVRNAVVNGIDLEKAIKTVGTSRGGQTPLQTLAGQVSTQGQLIHLTNMVATSGSLSVAGNVTVSPAKTLAGHVTVKLSAENKLASALGGAVAVPLVVGGTVEKPDVTLSRSALIGAAIGSALMPGAGTAAGASAGEKLGQGLRSLFGKK